MKEFIGTKILNAKPMTKLQYNIFRGWKLPSNEDGSEEGYLVEYTDGGKANVEGFDGYVSWSPKDVFEATYKENGDLSFGDALIFLQLGLKVARKGWNGKGMWISQTKGKILDLNIHDIWTQNVKDIAVENGGTVELLPYLVMKTADNKLQIGWLASQSDMHANDWGIV